MDKKTYHESLKKMHDAGVVPEYCHGWATGALGNPSIEEQRVTDAYTAGFEHGAEGVVDGYAPWLTKG